MQSSIDEKIITKRKRVDHDRAKADKLAKKIRKQRREAKRYGGVV